MIEGSCHCGAVRWRFSAVPDGATACNCTTCRRYGALWIYGHDGVDVSASGATRAYRGRSGYLDFHFCPTCGNVAYWLQVGVEEDGRRRMAVNVRLADPDAVAGLPIDHFDGLDSFDDLPRDGRRVADYWF